MTDLKILISKLNSVCRGAAESAATRAVAHGHSEVDVVHLLSALLECPHSDAAAIFQHFRIDRGVLSTDLNSTLERRASSSNSRTPILSARLIELLEFAWTIGSREYGITEIRSGLIVLGVAQSETGAQIASGVSPELLKLNANQLRESMLDLFSAEEGTVSRTPASEGDDESALGQFTIDLTAAARTGALDPVLGREAEIRQLIDILSRRRQNNPILTGEPGVGKTAIVEGFALRVASGNAPPSLRDVSVRTLDMGLLLAGASLRGEFEARLKKVMQEVQNAPRPVILFIDEAHTLVGGGQAEAANLLKPALARGNFRVIAATTYTEYRKYFEKDPALARRFQMIAVNEPSEEGAMQMLRSVIPLLEQHHGVRVLGEAIESAVRLSHRYVTGRQLPDKAIGILDTACARVSSAQNSMPSALEDRRHRIDVLEGEISQLTRERAAGLDVARRSNALFEELGVVEMELADLEDRCKEERGLVRQAVQLRAQVEDCADEELAASLRRELAQVNEALTTLQGDEPLVPAFVDSRVVAEVISESTGIPVRRMLSSELRTLLSLRKQIEARVVGQPHALDLVAKRIVSARAALEDPCRPTGVFLLTGPAGVGKTETAMALADILYGGERNAVVLNMSEYQETYSISGLKGSPPGYVGYGDGGVLTEAVRRRPYCVLLLDEMEKAHPDVMELFYQVFDKGTLEDSQGRAVDFRNTLIVMTSNVGSELIQELCGSGRMPSPEELRRALTPELQRVFKPALLSRMIVVPYYPIGDMTLLQIVELKIGEIARRLESSYSISFKYSHRVVEEIARRCVDGHSGARNVDHILTGTLIPDISEKVLCAAADQNAIHSISVDAGSGGELFRYQVE
ncbi:MAG TPA: type VI secretion system ATPase TssH [Bryobacteraceae bacterium]|jgi:type VI secretion system protein VasG|nr:type VI secretion system ATPase TssH [Bryobacteraceae bacterium]